MKYIDADRLIAEIERLRKEHTTIEYRDEAALVLEDLEDYIDSLQEEQGEKKNFDDYLKASPAERRKMNMTEILGAEKLAKVKEMMEQEQNPKVIHEVNDNVDKLRAISTPADEDWFKIAEEWEKEDKK